MNEVLKLAKELQEYTKVVGSHNIHIQEIANELVEALDQPTINENQMWMVWTNEFGVVAISNKAECEERYEQEKENYFSYDLMDVDESGIGHQVILAKLGKSCGLFECPDGLFEVKELDGTDLEQEEDND